MTFAEATQKDINETLSNNIIHAFKYTIKIIIL